MSVGLKGQQLLATNELKGCACGTYSLKFCAKRLKQRSADTAVHWSTLVSPPKLSFDTVSIQV